MVASLRSLSNVKSAVQYFYYTEKDLEAGSSWHESKAVSALEFKSITKENFERVLSGRLAKGVELGQRTKDGIKHHSGHDLTFSAPKSVSIMAMVAGDKRVLEAHELAVSRALDYVQRHLIYTRVQEGGNSELKRSDNALIARYTHITSRPPNDKTKPDPQLHTHCLIANATLREDGVWRSVVFDSLYDDKMLLGEIYRLELVKELASIGYEMDITRTSKGRFMFEIKGVSKEEIKTFSRRRKEILLEAEKRGVSDAADLADVALATRKSKSKTATSREELQKEWESRVRSISLLKDLSKMAEPKAKKPISKEAIMDVGLKYGIANLSNREAVFNEQNLHSNMIERLAEFFPTHDIGISDIEATTKAGIESGKLLCQHGDSLLTTPKNLKDEKQAIKLMQSMQGKVKPIAHKHEVRKYLNDKDLNSGKIDAITLALTTKDRIVGIQGSAGTGKTTTLSIIKEIAESKGRSVMGLAPTKAAVSVLKKHLPAHTLSYFLSKYDGVIHKRGSKEALQKLQAEFSKTLIVLDEASLASTSQMKNFLKLAEILKFRSVIMGDIRQLGAIPAGKPFYYLQDNGMNTCFMEEIKRQRNEELLQSVYLAESAVDKKQREAAQIIKKVIASFGENVIDVSKRQNEEDVAQVAYTTWLSLKEKDPLVVVPSHALRFRINALIRTHFVTGEDRTVRTLVSRNLTPAQMRYAKCYMQGDILRFGKDSSACKIKAGEYFEVVRIDENVLKLKQDERFIDYDLSYKSAATHFEVYEAKDLKIALGERIRWTRNSQKHDFIVNGNSVVIKSIKEGIIEFETKDGFRTLKLSDSDMQHIDYYYTATIFSVQGKSKDHVLGVFDSKTYKSLISQRALYVMTSRAKDSITVVMDNVEKVTRKLSVSTGAKTSAIEHQQKMQDQPGVINLNKARRAYFKYEPDTVKFKAVVESHFIKNPKLIKDVAVALFGEQNALDSQGKASLIFETKFRFDQHDYYRDTIVRVDLSTGEYRLLNNTDEEGSMSLYHLAQKHGLFEHQSIAEQNKKIEQVQRLLKNSEPIHGTLAAKYLAKHRKIDITKIKLSEDVRFMKRAYSSDTKDRHPALLVIGRNKDGILSAQVTYLNSNTQNKNTALPVVKRSMGVLKGSFVELTVNKDAKDVFIAEGVETALSIALVQPDARVICSLGSSNLAHIDLGKNKNIIICADNDGRQTDGEPSSSRISVEAASRALALKGNSVSIIMPDQTKTDFNDVLKVYGLKKLNQYIAPTITNSLNYKKIFEKLSTKIASTRQKTLSAEKKIRGVYSNSKLALGKINEVLSDSKVLSELKTTPEKFGELALPKAQAITLLEKHASTLILNKRLLKTHTAKLGQLTKNIKQKSLAHFDTSVKNIRNLEYDLEKYVFHALKMTDNRCDFESVERVTLKVAEQIVESRERFGKEPSSQQRVEFFLRARYELEREGEIKKQLAKTYADTPEDRMLLSEKLNRALSVDSRLANKDSLYYKPVSFSKVRAILKEGDAKILKLTEIIESKGVNGIIKAEFIAREIVKYEERNGTHMPTSHRQTLDTIGTYVSRGYDLLRKNELPPITASIIMYKEGALFSLYHNKKATQLPVSESTVKRIQKTAGQFYKESRALQGAAPAKQCPNIRSSSANKSAEIEI